VNISAFLTLRYHYEVSLITKTKDLLVQFCLEIKRGWGEEGREREREREGERERERERESCWEGGWGRGRGGGNRQIDRQKSMRP
jgi:hypothetical protein